MWLKRKGCVLTTTPRDCEEEEDTYMRRRIHVVEAEGMCAGLRMILPTTVSKETYYSVKRDLR